VKPAFDIPAGLPSRERVLSETSLPRFPFIGVPQTGHASDGSSSLRLEVGLLVIVHLLVKRDNHAIVANEQLDGECGLTRVREQLDRRNFIALSPLLLAEPCRC
jgi:hypothetical protein